MTHSHLKPVRAAAFRRAEPKLTLLLLTVVACSNGTPDPTLPASDATAPKSDASHHHHQDATLDAHQPTHDATPDVHVEAAPDAPARADASPDALDSTAASSDAVPDSPRDVTPPPICPGARDVLTLTQSHPGGPLGNLTTATLTNLDALWSASPSPLTLTATPGSGASTSLTVTLPFGATLVPGTYPQGAARPDGGPAVDLSYAGNECEETSGTFTLASLTDSDAGVAAVLATFSLACATGPGQTDEVTGCVRYQAEDGPVDATAPPSDSGYDAGLASAADAGALAPCLAAPQAFYVTGAPLASTPETITGADGKWSAGNDGTAMLTVEAMNEWALALAAPDQDSLMPGTTYTGAGNLPGTGPYFSLLANGVDCGSPSASFTVYDYADTGGDEATVTRLAATFTATCTVGGSTGTVTGCVHYVE